MTLLEDEGKAVDVVYLNFRKAFDTVPHSTLLEKLAAHGLDDSMIHYLWNLGEQPGFNILNMNPSLQTHTEP